MDLFPDADLDFDFGFNRAPAAPAGGPRSRRAPAAAAQAPARTAAPPAPPSTPAPPAPPAPPSAPPRADVPVAADAAADAAAGAAAAADAPADADDPWSAFDIVPGLVPGLGADGGFGGRTAFGGQPVSRAWASADDASAPPGRGASAAGEAPPAPEHDPLLAGLTAPQRAAVLHHDGPMIVTAGPGSGKTRVLAHRVAYLVARRRVAPWQVLAVTFTNKAAGEMRERIRRLLETHAPWLGADGGEPRVSTFHAFCAATLRRFGPPRRTTGFAIYDDDDQRALLKRLLRDELKLDAAQWRPGDVKGRISSLKNRMIGPSDAEAAASGFHDRTFARIYAAYEDALERMNALDFDDLLLSTLRLVEDRADVLDALRRRHRYVLVDEYQDTNRPQYLLAQRLTGADGNLFVVGDVDQSIYAWRGAEVRNLLEFEEDHPRAVEVRLEQNFRSTGTIVRCAQALIEHNRERREKTLHTDNPDGPPAVLLRCLSEDDEAVYVASEVARELAEGRDPSELAVFFRTNALSRRFEEELRHRSIRHVVVGAVPFYARREVKDALAFLRVLVNPADEQAFGRVIAAFEGLGAKSFERIAEAARARAVPIAQSLVEAALVPEVRGRQRLAAERLGKLVTELAAMPEAPVLPVLKRALEGSGYLARLAASDDPQDDARAENLEALLNGAAEFDQRFPQAGRRGFLDQAALLSGTDETAGERGAVRMMTLHAAKGLEFDVVFITAVDEGLLPLERQDDPGDEEEERRLFYVGITRARERLVLTSAAIRRTYGTTRTALPSRFLKELPQDLVLRTGRWGPGLGGGAGEAPAASGGGRWPGSAGGAPPARGGAARGVFGVGGVRPGAPLGRGWGAADEGGGAGAGALRRRGARGGFDDEFPPDPPHQDDDAEALAPARAAKRAAVRESGGAIILPGCQVEHDRFGRGRVLTVSGAGARQVVEVSFLGIGVKRLYTEVAKLRRV